MLRTRVTTKHPRAMRRQVNECDQPGRGGCWADGNLSACVDTFRGHKCVCPPGTVGNGYACEDVDECAQQVRRHGLLDCLQAR